MAWPGGKIPNSLSETQVCSWITYCIYRLAKWRSFKMKSLKHTIWNHSVLGFINFVTCNYYYFCLPLHVESFGSAQRPSGAKGPAGGHTETGRRWDTGWDSSSKFQAEIIMKMLFILPCCIFFHVVGLPLKTVTKQNTRNIT